MNKTIYIGDIHGRSIWKNIVQENDDADTIVFVGDYFDSFNIPGLSQLNNAQDIVNYKLNNPNKDIHLLLGNHDIHYFHDNKWDKGMTSGYQAFMSVQYEEFFREYRKHFKISCIVNENRLCSHAGVSHDFLNDNGFYLRSGYSFNDIPDFLNELFETKIWSMNFDSYRHRNQDYGYVDHYGNDIWQTPVWIRPKSLQLSNKNRDLKKEVIQIVGHTQQEKIDIEGRTTGGRYFYIDSLENKQYLIEENGNFKLGIID